ncbi:MAG: hypothetical protein CO113_14975 [Elusimicrobia bacterium CG_4_9_14_3_um_filter_62_55]|nr:MAG: hypothetical protein COR54_16245 [Elusimicrobia bacterium CG22_combo_CG10-13_8_21_14_all_63_91]PJA18008.1 MAG: hypothetical protein COX66_02660 [Elusimicrobia bacterium CG_4_10_14_0_2_um_filter_63_34]PJB24228.1 MAG: hypothetical protein CO113_14975 [Elusimicrobia bacterium CG_4_9_14_3_um_filter_62_55]
MALILRRGKVPSTPHTEFYGKPGLFSLEEIHGSYGFSGAWSRKLHARSYPTEMALPPKSAGFVMDHKPLASKPLQPFLLQTADIPAGQDAVRGRRSLLLGSSTVVSVVKPVRSMPKDQYFKNGEKHELFYVQEGRGTFSTEFGDLKFRPGHYLVVPKGVTYRVELDGDSAFLLLMESNWPISWPDRYLNPEGQAMMTAPIVETEIETPVFRGPIDKKGRYPVEIQHAGGLVTRMTLSHHPFDLVGWEGALYPFAFDIKNHHGIQREIHSAPPQHQTFESGKAPDYGFAICSFVSQIEGWHPKEVPAPYAHFNVDSDEMMFFSNANYAAREGVIRPGSMTFHPCSVVHSPHGDSARRSTSQRGKKNDRRAVMLDTFFENLQITETAWKYRDKGYAMSWYKMAHGT